MSDLWLGALRMKMESAVHDRDETRRALAGAGATSGETAARAIDATEVESPVRERGIEAMRAASGENAR